MYLNKNSDLKKAPSDVIFDEMVRLSGLRAVFADESRENDALLTRLAAEMAARLRRNDGVTASLVERLERDGFLGECWRNVNCVDGVSPSIEAVSPACRGLSSAPDPWRVHTALNRISLALRRAAGAPEAIASLFATRAGYDFRSVPVNPALACPAADDAPMRLPVRKFEV